MKFSFIVPCYNSHNTIKKCLDSIMNQTYSDFECIMFNDGSTDDTEIILKEYSIKDKRFKYFYHKNKGTSKTTNECIKVSSGEYIVPVDHDDWVESNLLELLNEIIDKHCSELIGFECDFFPKKDCNNINDGKCLIPKSYNEKMTISFHKSLLFMTHTSTCIKRELFNSVSFDGCGYGADTVVMQILIHKTSKICQYNKTLYHRYRNDYSVSSIGDRKSDALFSISERMVKQLYFFKKDNAEHAYELRMAFPWYMSGLATMNRFNPKNIVRFLICGWRIFFNKQIVMQEKHMTIKNYLWLLLPFIPIKPKM